MVLEVDEEERYIDEQGGSSGAIWQGLPSRDVASIDSIHLSKMLFGSARGTGHSRDAVMSRLRVDVRGVRRHDARGDVEILGRVVARLGQELGLDASFNGVRRHAAALPAIQGAA